MSQCLYNAFSILQFSPNPLYTIVKYKVTRQVVVGTLYFTQHMRN